MATKSKTTVAKSGAVKDEAKAEKGRAAKYAVSATLNAAIVMDSYAGKTYGEIELQQLIESLSEHMDEINDGNLQRVENMLFGQAQALQSIFVNLARKASGQEYLKQYETFLRLALKAQSQCRVTLEALAAIKNPPVIFAKQANIANGHQQINNGAAIPAHAHAEENKTEQNKLIEAQHGNYLDTGTTGEASGSNQTLETVGAIDRADIGRG